MSSETSSRSTGSPSSLVNVASNAVEWVVNGGAVLPKEWTTRTRLASAAVAGAAQIASNNTASASLSWIVMAAQESHSRRLWQSARRALGYTTAYHADGGLDDGPVPANGRRHTPRPDVDRERARACDRPARRPDDVGIALHP